jgi:tRNA U55 pseudouridine synthase TruB
MSRGMYVRSLAQDISAAVNDSGFVYSLVRTRNGEYTKKNVETMEDVFGKKYMDEFDFVSRTTS